MVGYDPGFPNRPIASPLMYDERTGTYEWGIPQLAIDALENVVLPGAVLQGYQPSMADVTEFGAGVGTGGVAASTAGGVPRGALGMFAGPRAKTADLYNLEAAQDLLKNRRQNKLSLTDIRAETGWEPVRRPHEEVRWRFEIPDDRAVLMDPSEYNVPARIEALADTAPVDYRNIKQIEGAVNPSPDLTDLYFKLLERNGILTPNSLGARLDHPELYRAYPGMAKTPTSFRDLGSTMHGEFSSATNTPAPRVYDAPGSISVSTGSPDPLSTTLHEVQHGIQRYEDWPMGPNTRLAPEFRKRDYTDPSVQAALAGRQQAADRLRDAQTPEQVAAAQEYLRHLDEYIDRAAEHAMYRRHSGEVEARLTQARQPMDRWERGPRAPQLDMDVPYFRQWD
jgi:hypothetical protein